MAFVNKNISYSFNFNVTTALAKLSGFTASEVLISNKSGQVINIFDNDRYASDNSFQLDDNDSVIIRGITNTNQVSAQTTSGNGTVYFRSAYFSNLNQF
jgi:hypothetical protein|tara:strand:- start:148 stop:444 length:297 start_codon:yes stop_codon:yes gene_type:complete